MDFANIAQRITSPYSLAAYGLAAVVYILLRRKGSVPQIAWIAIVLLVATPMAASVIIELFKPPGVYNVRTIALSPEGSPVDGVTFACSVPCEPKPTKGGSEVTVADAQKPQDGRVTIYANLDRNHLAGRGELSLSGDHHPTITIQLKKFESAEIRGRVQDKANNAIEGANVSVSGYPAIQTGKAGDFVVQTHKAAGEDVVISVEKIGYKSLSEQRLAGEQDVILVLDRK